MNLVQKNEYRFRAMGTEFLFRIYADSSRSLECETTAQAGIERVRDLEAQLSEFLPLNPLGLIHASLPGQAVPVTLDFCKLFEKALELKKRTLSSFDPFIKSSVRVGEFDYDYDGTLQVFTKIHPQLRLSFGAIGKGFALDEVAGLFREAGFSSFVISAGGSSIIRSQVLGFPGEETIFWVLDKSSDSEGGAFEGTYLTSDKKTLEKSISYAVSAEYERGRHILSHAPVSNLKATLVADVSACTSDALATAFFVAGWSGVAKWGDKTAFLSIDDEKIPMWNQAAARCFKIPTEWTA